MALLSIGEGGGTIEAPPPLKTPRTSMVPRGLSGVPNWDPIGTSLPDENTRLFRLEKNTPAVRETHAPLGIMGDQLSTPLKPLGTIKAVNCEGFQGVSSNWLPMIPRDASLSDNYTQ